MLNGILTGWMAHASLGLLFGGLVVAGLGVPIPEDIVLLMAGSLCHRSTLPLALVIVACAVGVLLGDVLLFTSARRLGGRALGRPLFQRLLPKERRRRIENMFVRRGSALVFVARHVAGLRAPVFALAGIHGMPLRRFLFWDALGMLVSVPVTVALGYVFSEHLERIRAGMASVRHWGVALLTAALVVYALVVQVRRSRRRSTGTE